MPRSHVFSVRAKPRVRRTYSRGWSVEDRAPPRGARIESQDPTEIRRKCLVQGAIWTDPEFPACSASLSPKHKDVVWLRPPDICQYPEMVTEGLPNFEMIPGELGGSWLARAMAALWASSEDCGRRELFYRLVPPDNSFVRDYAGVFHFRLWRYGRWIDLPVDDQLPTRDGKLICLHSATGNEFWAALLEKAYAKLHGSYEALAGGEAIEALEDFTGGITETYVMGRLPVNNQLFKSLQQGAARCSIVVCSCEISSLPEGTRLENGLMSSHSYNVTAVKNIKFRGRDHRLVRLRDPYGVHEWNGAWSEQSDEWKDFPRADRVRLGVVNETQREFWMNFADFVLSFTKAEMLHLTPDDLTRDIARCRRKRKWRAVRHEGSWRTHVNAGGCRNFLSSFWTNPQYRIQISGTDEGDDESGTLLVALMQKERRILATENCSLLCIGVAIYRVGRVDCGPLGEDFFKFNKSMGRSQFTNTREVCSRHALPAGHYVIVPSTYQPDRDGQFVLRAFAEQEITSGELDESTSMIPEETSETGRLLQMLTDPTFPVAALTSEVVHPPNATNLAFCNVEARKRRQRSIQVTDGDVVEERAARDAFKRWSGGAQQLDSDRLRQLLNDNIRVDFSKDAARSIVSMLDSERGGSFGYAEFKRLWTDLRQWRKVFDEFDLEKKGFFKATLLRQALNSAGFRVSNSTFRTLVVKFKDANGHLGLEEFVICLAKLHTMFDVWYSSSKPGEGAKFELDEFIQSTMYC